MVNYEPVRLDLLPEPEAVRDIHTLLLLIEALDLTNLRPEWIDRLYAIRRRYPWPGHG